MARLLLRIPNMTGEPDLEAVRELVNGMNEVAVVAADPAARTITVEYDPDHATPAEIVGYLASSGYPVSGNPGEG